MILSLLGFALSSVPLAVVFSPPAPPCAPQGLCLLDLAADWGSARWPACMRGRRLGFEASTERAPGGPSADKGYGTIADRGRVCRQGWALLAQQSKPCRREWGLVVRAGDWGSGHLGSCLALGGTRPSG